MSSVDEQLARIDAQILELREQREQAQRRRMVACMRCKKRTRIGKLLYVQHRDYEEPYSCSGGDYYYDGEGGFICPHCLHSNRVVEKHYPKATWCHPKSAQLYKLRAYFSDVVKVYSSLGNYEIGDKKFKSIDLAYAHFKARK